MNNDQNNNQVERYDIAIIGAGAAGLFSAACLAGSSAKIILLEKGPRPGQKLLMAGSGQCNLTHGGSVKEFLEHYGPGGKQIRSVLYQYSNEQVMHFFEQQGIPLFTREDGKVFPRSLQGSDVRNALLKLLAEAKIEIACLCPVLELTPANSGFLLRCSDRTVQAARVIVSSGGASYPTTGSDGRFLAVLETLGLGIVPPRPALTPIFTADYPYESLSGISFSPGELTLCDNVSGKKLAANTDDLLLTHRGFSGPGILNLSRYAAQGQRLRVNYLPGIQRSQLEKQLKTAAQGESRQVIHFLSQQLPSLPRRFLELICIRCAIETTEKTARLSGSQLSAAAAVLTEDAHIITGLGGLQTAMVTAGGVSLSEVSLKTMESKRYPGLYFAGEVLDVDGDTGGYNLQFAFSSAHLAAANCT